MERKLKKLELKKEVITKLSDEKMNLVRGGTFTTVTVLGEFMERNSDGPYFPECDNFYYEPVGNSQVVLYGGCLITE